jgi:hypothetical protein
MCALQVSAGRLAARIAPEGVMLQYAVDSGLDGLLADLYLHLTRPPLDANPLPAVVQQLRARAALLELWRVRRLLQNSMLEEQKVLSQQQFCCTRAWRRAGGLLAGVVLCTFAQLLPNCQSGCAACSRMPRCASQGAALHCSYLITIASAAAMLHWSLKRSRLRRLWSDQLPSTGSSTAAHKT